MSWLKTGGCQQVGDIWDTGIKVQYSFHSGNIKERYRFPGGGDIITLMLLVANLADTK